MKKEGDCNHEDIGPISPILLFSNITDMCFIGRLLIEFSRIYIHLKAEWINFDCPMLYSLYSPEDFSISTFLDNGASKSAR